MLGSTDFGLVPFKLNTPFVDVDTELLFTLEEKNPSFDMHGAFDNRSHYYSNQKEDVDTTSETVTQIDDATLYQFGIATKREWTPKHDELDYIAAREALCFAQATQSLQEAPTTNQSAFKRPKLMSQASTISAPTEVANPVPTFTKAKSKRHESSWKVWTKTEEIFLVGAVFELLFERGSLTASNERSEVWQTVKAKYDNAWNGYAAYRSRLEAVGQSEYRDFDHDDRAVASVRSSKALYRHYKVLKERVAGNSTNAPPPGTIVFSFQRYYAAWLEIRSKVFGIRENRNCQDILCDIL